jgi:hypothetical protein
VSPTRTNTTSQSRKVCSAVSGTASATDCCATVTRAVTAEPGRQRPSVLSSVARATVLWLAVAVPGSTRSSVVCACTPSLIRVTVTGAPGCKCVASAPNTCRSTHSFDRSAISNSGAPSGTTAPTAALRASTTPEIGATTLYCVRLRLLSMLASGWPARTRSPTLARNARTGPGKRAIAFATRPSTGVSRPCTSCSSAITPGPAGSTRMPDSRATAAAMVVRPS